jgi:hypothetical protein
MRIHAVMLKRDQIRGRRGPHKIGWGITFRAEYLGKVEAIVETALGYKSGPRRVTFMKKGQLIKLYTSGADSYGSV